MGTSRAVRRDRACRERARLWLRAATLGASACCCFSCVFGATRAPTHADAARGVVVDRTPQRSALSDTLEARRVRDVPPKHVPKGQRWVRGYFHWTGTEYVWVPGQLEPMRTSFARD